MKTKNSTWMLLTAALALGACADRQTTVMENNGDKEDVAYVDYDKDQVAHLSSHTVTFPKGSAVLSEAARAQIRELVQSASARGEIADIKVAVWSDRQLPKNRKAELSRADRILANSRSDVVHDYLVRTLKAPSPEVYSMAEHANWFARMFNTTDAELKSGFARRDYDITEAQYQMLRNGRPSQAVIVIETR